MKAEWDTSGHTGRHAPVMDPVLTWLQARPGIPAHYVDIARALHLRPKDVYNTLRYVLRFHADIPVRRAGRGFYAWQDGPGVPVQSGRAPSAVIRASMADVQLAGILADVIGPARVRRILGSLDRAGQDIPHNGGTHSYPRKQAR